MTNGASFIDTNVWLYRLFDDQRIERTERERKRNIAISITSNLRIIISTQVVNEVCANLLKKAAFNEEQIIVLNTPSALPHYLAKSLLPKTFWTISKDIKSVIAYASGFSSVLRTMISKSSHSLLTKSSISLKK